MTTAAISGAAAPLDEAPGLSQLYHSERTRLENEQNHFQNNVGLSHFQPGPKMQQQQQQQVSAETGTAGSPTITTENGVPGRGDSTSSPIPVPRNLDHLIRLLREELGEKGLDSEHVDVDRIRAIMTAYDSQEKDWSRYAYFDRCRYTRNLVDDGNGKFNLIILAWGQELKSSIHDHANCHCLMKVLDGALSEEIFEWPEADVVEPSTATGTSDDSGMDLATGTDSEDHVCGSPDSPRTKPCGMMRKWTRQYNRNEVAYIHDKIGLHRVSNQSTVKPAVSLHLYTPPFSEVRTFTESGVTRRKSTMTFYSVKGQKVEHSFTV